MRIVLFCHSLRSDWNHGNAHFLRGIVRELKVQGHHVTSYEPNTSWSATNLRESHGEAALEGYRNAYPELPVHVYDTQTFNISAVRQDAELALVHEWSEPELVAAAGLARRTNPGLRLLFHDTHHRSVTDPEAMSRYDLSNYDGVLAFGESIRQQYLRRGWAEQVWTWHEAADTALFHPLRGDITADLVWIGNWGDDERASELGEFLIEPAKHLGLQGAVYGVRYPPHAIQELRHAGLDYLGWLPNYRAPEIYSHYRFTIHVPRRPYADALRGIPTIRMFEALACGIPLVSAPWEDSEGLFPDDSYLRARDGVEMRSQMRSLLQNPALSQHLSVTGRKAIEDRHTCAHRVRELLSIYETL